MPEDKCTLQLNPIAKFIFDFWGENCIPLEFNTSTHRIWQSTRTSMVAPLRIEQESFVSKPKELNRTIRQNDLVYFRWLAEFQCRRFQQNYRGRKLCQIERETISCKTASGNLTYLVFIRWRLAWRIVCPKWKPSVNTVKLKPSTYQHWYRKIWPLRRNFWATEAIWGQFFEGLNIVNGFIQKVENEFGINITVTDVIIFLYFLTTLF